MFRAIRDKVVVEVLTPQKKSEILTVLSRFETHFRGKVLSVGPKVRDIQSEDIVWIESKHVYAQDPKPVGKIMGFKQEQISGVEE